MRVELLNRRAQCRIKLLTMTQIQRDDDIDAMIATVIVDSTINTVTNEI